jgi:hypothetical protein
MNSILGYLKKPLILGICALILGFGLGLLWGWGIQPVQWTDNPPTLLRSDYQVDYLRMTIDSYGLNGNQALAKKRWADLGTSGQSALQVIQTYPDGQDTTLILQFKDMVAGTAAVVTPVPTASTGTDSGGSSVGRIALIGLAILAILVVAYALVKFLKPNFRQRSAAPVPQVEEFARETEMTDFSVTGDRSPIAQFVATYVSGDDLFDDSFSVDSASGEFLGECGVGISETIGVGDPKKVSAFEVWMFDKNDIQTVTKVLMSAHAFNDPATFQRLQAKGEPILLAKGQKITLETATLQMIATVAEGEYGQSALPTESFFNRVTLELAIWQKSLPIG